ncbi:MAG: hypothetical protein WAM14_05750 [Candidatus Nitrosopolaris sp.]
MNKTGFERTGFDGIHVCASGVFLGEHKNGCFVRDKWIDNPCINIIQEQVDKSKKWLRAHAKRVEYINTNHSSYGLNTM